MGFAVMTFRQVASLKCHPHARATRCFAAALGVSERGDCSSGGGGAVMSYSWVRARGDCGSGWNGDDDEIDLGRHREQEPTHLDPLSLTLDPLCLTDLKNDPRAHWSQHSFIPEHPVSGTHDLAQPPLHQTLPAPAQPRLQRIADL
uniref:Uncharacterized protein n=1 Tax=Oryza rufipogon TaxID=4529 RepID=A0A0E0PXY8_ORYRU